MPILWLASYPRSGNTWLRVFFSNLGATDDAAAADINQLAVSAHAGNRYTFDEALAIESSDMSSDEVDRFRPQMYRVIAGQAATSLIVKVHDAFGFTSSGEPMFPTNATAGAIYVVRNPLDVAVSLVHFMNRPVDYVIEAMADEDRALAVDGFALQLRQRLSSWSCHVVSWMDLPGFPVHVVKYEAMCARPRQTFTSVARFAALRGASPGRPGNAFNPQSIDRAIDYASFAKLSQQERDSGFRGIPSSTRGYFFRSGTVGSWRTALSATQVDRVLDHHADAMRRLGYLSAQGEVVDYVEPGVGGGRDAS